MTMPSDPFQPQAGEAPVDPAGAAQEWTTVLQDPKTRATMLSMGLQLMSSPGWGQSTGGHIAQAIGAGGETLANIEKMDQTEREQSRRERDTESNIQSREDRSEIGRANSEVAAERANSSRILAESSAAYRATQGQLNLAKVNTEQAKVQALEMKTQLFPQDAQAKIDLARARQTLLEAQAGLVGARTEAVAPVAASQVRRNESAADLNDTRATNVGANTDLRRGQLDATNRKLTLQEKIDQQKGERQDRRTYETAKTSHDKLNAMKPRSQQTPFMSYQEWLKGNSSSAAPVAPAANGPDSALPAMPTSKGDLKANTRYMTPRGPATWNGEKFVQ